MDPATVPPPHGTVWALGCPNSRPPPEQTREKVPHAKSSWTLAAAAHSAHGNGFLITVSAEAVISPISRLSQHRMMLCNVCGAWKLFRRPLTVFISRICSYKRHRQV